MRFPRAALAVVASSNAQAKNISSDAVQATTLHKASAMRIQELRNRLMRPGDDVKAKLKRL